MADNLRKLSEDLKAANAAKKGKGIIDVEDIKSKLGISSTESPSIIDMAKRELKGFSVKQPKSESPDIPGQRSLNKKGADVEEKVSTKADSKPAEKPKAKKAGIKKLKDTSKEYWSADGLSGDIGSASGESGPDMGRVNKGGYDPEEGMKRGGKVKKMAGGGSVSSASRRADGCAVRGKTKGRVV